MNSKDIWANINTLLLTFSTGEQLKPEIRNRIRSLHLHYGLSLNYTLLYYQLHYLRRELDQPQAKKEILKNIEATVKKLEEIGGELEKSGRLSDDQTAHIDARNAVTLAPEDFPALIEAEKEKLFRKNEDISSLNIARLAPKKFSWRGLWQDVKEQCLFPVGRFIKRNFFPIAMTVGAVTSLYYAVIKAGNDKRIEEGDNLDIFNIFGEHWGNKQEAADMYYSEAGAKSTFLAQEDAIRYYLSQVLFASKFATKFAGLALTIPALTVLAIVGRWIYNHRYNKSQLLSKANDNSYSTHALFLVAFWSVWPAIFLIAEYQNSMPDHLKISKCVSDSVDISFNSKDKIKAGIAELAKKAIPGCYSNLFLTTTYAFSEAMEKRFSDKENDTFTPTNAFTSWSFISFTSVTGMFLAYLFYKNIAKQMANVYLDRYSKLANNIVSSSPRPAITTYGTMNSRGNSHEVDGITVEEIRPEISTPPVASVQTTKKSKKNWPNTILNGIKALGNGIYQHRTALTTTLITITHLVLFKQMQHRVGKITSGVHDDCHSLKPFGQHWGSSEQENFNQWIAMPGNKKTFTSYCSSLSPIMGMSYFAHDSDKLLGFETAMEFQNVFLALGVGMFGIGLINAFINWFQHRKQKESFIKKAFIANDGSYFPALMLLPLPIYAMAPGFYMGTFIKHMTNISASIKLPTAGKISLKLSRHEVVDAVKKIAASPYGLANPFFLAPIMQILEAAQEHYTKKSDLTTEYDVDISSYFKSLAFWLPAVALFLTSLPLIRQRAMTQAQEAAVNKELEELGDEEKGAISILS